MFVRALAWGVGGGVILAALDAAHEANSASFGAGLLIATLLTFAVLGLALFLVVASCELAQRLLWPEVSQPAADDGNTSPPGDTPARQVTQSHPVQSTPSS